MMDCISPTFSRRGRQGKGVREALDSSSSHLTYPLFFAADLRLTFGLFEDLPPPSPFFFPFLAFLPPTFAGRWRMEEGGHSPSLISSGPERRRLAGKITSPA